MVRTWRWAAVSTMACVLVACPARTKNTGDGGDDGAASASAVVEAGPAPLAANDSSVTRYPDETSINHAAVSTVVVANARTQAGPGGELVAALKRGTECDKIAQRQGYDLVLFPDPSDATRKEMGWVSQGAFSAELPAPKRAVDAGTTPSAVPATVDAGGGPPARSPDVRKNADGSCPAGYAACAANYCRLQCKSDSDCGGSAHCQAGFCMRPGAAPCAGK